MTVAQSAVRLVRADPRPMTAEFHAAHAERWQCVSEFPALTAFQMTSSPTARFLFLGAALARPRNTVGTILAQCLQLEPHEPQKLTHCKGRAGTPHQNGRGSELGHADDWPTASKHSRADEVLPLDTQPNISWLHFLGFGLAVLPHLSYSIAKCLDMQVSEWALQ
eukprot:7319415-Prymnesium_polylepis.1